MNVLQERQTSQMSDTDTQPKVAWTGQQLVATDLWQLLHVLVVPGVI